MADDPRKAFTSAGREAPPAPPLPPVRIPPNPSPVMRIGRAIYEWLKRR